MNATVAGADTVVIERLHLRLPAGSPVDERRDALRGRLLRGTRWPRVAEDEVLIVRRLSISARWADADVSVAEAVGRAVARARQQAAAGRAVAAHGGGDSVRFASRDALVAALAADLAGGLASERWWWATGRDFAPLLALPRAAALARLLGGQVARLGSVLALLDGAGQLAAVLRALDQGAARAIGDALWTHVGYGGASEKMVFSGAQPPARAKAGPARAVPHDGAGAGDEEEPEPLPSPVIAALRRRWSAVLRDWAADDARVQLVVLVAVLEVRPALLAAGPAAPALRALARALVVAPADRRAPRGPAIAEAAPARPSSPPVAAAPAGGGARGRSGESVGEPFAVDAFPGEASSDAGASDPVPVPEPASLTGDVKPAPAALPLCDRVPAAPADTAATPEAMVDPAAWPRGGDEIPTAFAGTFYLVNALADPQLARIAGDAQALAAPGGGWALLAGWAQMLGADPRDSLLVWLRGQQRLARGADEALADTASLAGDAAAYTDLAARLSAVARMRWAEPVWSPALIAVPGTVRATRTHVDVSMPLASVRLDVRLAGLDLDPGFVRWLGRVVSFHYQEPGEAAP